MNKATIRVKDLGDVVTGNTPSTDNPEYYGDSYLFIKATDIDENSKYTLNTEDMYSKKAFTKYRDSLIPKDSTCVVTIGSVGKKITMSHENLFVNQAINAVIPSTKFDNEYVYYLMKENLPQLKILNSGTASGRENISKTSFEKMKLIVDCDINNQIKAGKILSTIDKVILNNKEIIKSIEDILRKYYDKTFVYDSNDREQIYVKLNSLVNRRDVKLKEWDDLKLVDLSRMPRFSISLLNIGDAIELQTNIKEVKEYDLIFGSIRPYLGKAGFSPINGAIAGSVFNFTPKDNNMYSYLLFLISSKDFIKFADNYSNGTKMPVVDYDDLMRYRIKLLINRNIYKEFNDFCMPFIKEIKNKIEENIKLSELRDSLSNRIFTFKLNLENAKIE